MLNFLRSIFRSRNIDSEVLPLSLKSVKKTSPKRETKGDAGNPRRARIIEFMQNRKQGKGSHPPRKISKAWRKEACLMWEEGMSTAEIAATFCVNRTKVNDAIRERHGKQVSNRRAPLFDRLHHREKIIREMQTRMVRGSNRPNAFLSRAWRDEAVAMYHEGQDIEQIAAAFKVSTVSVRVALRTRRAA